MKNLKFNIEIILIGFIIFAFFLTLTGRNISSICTLLSL